MRLHLLELPFVVLWIGGAIAAGVVGLFMAVFRGRPDGLLALLFPLVGVGLMASLFGDEARVAERLLRAIYADSPELPEGRSAYR
jgi:hypothetical protein